MPIRTLGLGGPPPTGSRINAGGATDRKDRGWQKGVREEGAKALIFS